LAYQKYDDAAKADALKKVLTWAITDGQEMSADLGYIPLPENVVTRVQEAIDSINQ